ncbi:MAG: hypothetical protein ABR928_03925 [Terracidiphilus sp.]|jgi:hypothetical protein
MRDRFLARAASEGLKIQAGPSVEVVPPAAEFELQEKAAALPRRFLGLNQFFAMLRPPQAWAIVGSACLACVVLGLVVRTTSMTGRRDSSVGSALPAPRLQATPAALPVDTNAERLRALITEHDRLTSELADLDHQLQAAQKEKQQTDSALQQKLAAAQFDEAHDREVLTQQATVLNARVSELQSQLDSARQQESLTASELHNAGAKTSEYAARLDLMQAQLRNQDAEPLPGPNQVSSLVAARNLHIIDVYDSNANGKRGRPFGRVFYVEGRSLVFYAYDLPTARTQQNISFHLWGEKAGIGETTLSLGVLHDDDPRDRRWALTCNDPNLLAKINSVYVTAESPGKPNDAPNGPRVLYAYFGAPPNHP